MLSRGSVRVLLEDQREHQLTRPPALTRQLNQLLDLTTLTSPDGVAEVPEVEPRGSDRKSTRLNSSHSQQSRMPSSA